MFRAPLFACLLLLAPPSRAAPQLDADEELAACAISPEFSSDHTLFASLPQFNLLLRSRDGGETFEVVNAGLRSARVIALAISPDYARDLTLYAAEERGVFRTRNAGERWQPLTLPDGLEAGSGIAISPNYASDRTVAVSSATDGLWISRNAGDTWTRSVLPGEEPDNLLPEPKHVAAVIFSPDFARDRRVWALLDGRTLIATTDGAATFAALASPSERGLQALALDVAADTFWLGTNAHGVLVSTDGGANWKSAGAEMDLLDVPQLALARDASNQAVIFASTAHDGVFFKSGAVPWRSNRMGFLERSAPNAVRFLGAMPSPDFPRDHLVFAATSAGLYVSHTGGDGWKSVDVLTKRLVRSVAMSSHFADDGALWLSTYGDGLLELRPVDGSGGASPAAGVPKNPPLDSAAHFSCRRVETHSMFPEAVAVSPSPNNSRSILIATPGRLLLSTDGGASARTAIELDPGSAHALAFAPDFTESGIAFADLPPRAGAGPQVRRFTRSADRGLSWQNSSLGAVNDVAFAPDWKQSGRMYAAGSDSLWLSRDRGMTFERVERLEAKDLESVAVAAGGREGKDPDILLVASRTSGLQLSRDGGATWRALSGNITGIGFTSVELTPKFATDGLAFAGPPTEGVFVTRDGGETWTPSKGGARAVLAMERSPTFARDHTLLVGSYDGAWISKDAAASWTRVESSQPSVGNNREGTRRALLVGLLVGVLLMAGSIVVQRRRSRAISEGTGPAG